MKRSEEEGAISLGATVFGEVMQAILSVEIYLSVFSVCALPASHVDIRHHTLFLEILYKSNYIVILLFYSCHVFLDTYASNLRFYARHHN